MFDPDATTEAQTECEGLLEQARRLYPQSRYLQHEWLRAVLTVRMTHKGWLLDGYTNQPAPLPLGVRWGACA